MLYSVSYFVEKKWRWRRERRQTEWQMVNNTDGRITVDPSFVISHLYAHKVAKCTIVEGIVEGTSKTHTHTEYKLRASAKRIITKPAYNDVVGSVRERERDRKRKSILLRTIYC